MKKARVLLSLILLITLFGTVSLAESIHNSEKNLYHKINNLGYEKIYTDIEDTKAIIKIDINEKDFISDLSEIFVLAYHHTEAKDFALELYDIDSKLFTVSSSREIINQYISKRISEADLLNQLAYTDERSIEEKLKLDLEILDTQVYQVRLNENDCQIALLYNGDDLDQLIIDLPNMHLLVIEHAPWIEKTTLNIENHIKDESLQFTLKTENLLKLIRQEIDYEGYYDLADISVEQCGSWMDRIAKAGSFIGGIKQIQAIDIILLVIIATCGFYGYKKGFVTIIFSFLSYLLAIIGAKTLSPKVVSLLTANTAVPNKIEVYISKKFTSFGLDINVFNSELPDINQLITQDESIRQVMTQNPLLMKLLSEQRNTLANHQTITAMLSNYILMIISMVVIFILLKIIISHIGKIIKSRSQFSMADKINKPLGIILGIATGLIIITLGLLVVMPISLMSSSDSFTSVVGNSFILEKLLQIVSI